MSAIDKASKHIAKRLVYITWLNAIKNIIMNKTSFLLLRLAIGTSMFGHGLVRLPKLATFSNWMVTSFQKSFLPQALVVPFSYALPFAEFAVGFLLIVGLFTKQALVAGSL